MNRYWIRDSTNEITIPQILVSYYNKENFNDVKKFIEKHDIIMSKKGLYTVLSSTTDEYLDIIKLLVERDKNLKININHIKKILIKGDLRKGGGIIPGRVTVIPKTRYIRRSRRGRISSRGRGYQK